MSRRTLTLLIAGFLAVVLTAGASQARVPYVALQPGPTFNTLGTVDPKDSDSADVLEISGRQTFPVDGHLDLTTVGVQARLTLAGAVRDWFRRDVAVVPREVVYPPTKTDQQVAQENVESMKESQDIAVSAAARQLGFRIADVTVKDVPAGSPSAGVLRAGDRFTTVDGKDVRDAADLRALVSVGAPGRVVRLGIVRAAKPLTVEVTAAASSDDGPKRPIIGVETAEEPVNAPFRVTIGLQDVGGPSAGLMFTLGILDKLGEQSLTGGKFIAGTGEISATGVVGPIGGISQKLVAAKAKGAVAFLVPADNCAEALRRRPDDLPLVKVASLDDALAGLEAVRQGKSPQLCG